LSAYAWTPNPIRFFSGPTNIWCFPLIFFTACNSRSRDELNNSGINEHPCFTLRFYAIFSDRIPFISITDNALRYIFEIIFCDQSGKLCCFIVDVINSCGIDPNAFVKSIAVTTRPSFFRFALCSNLFKITPCSL
jgi:hypothetical protein